MEFIFTRNALIKFYIVVLAIFLVSFLRPTLLILLPFFLSFYFVLFNVKYSIYPMVIFPLLILVVVLIGIYYIGEFHAGNFILSTYIILPLLLLFFSKSRLLENHTKSIYIDYFLMGATGFLILSNCIGFMQLALHPNTDDAFIGLYGTSGLGVHSLCMINFMMSSYYFLIYSNRKNRTDLLLCVFFLISGVVCFYGLGLIIFIVSIVAYNFSIKSAFRTLFISFFVLAFLGVSLYFIRPSTFQYNYDNLVMVKNYVQGNVTQMQKDKIPRKLVVYQNYFNIYCYDPVLFLFGSGPGTFNSRSSFLLNGEYSTSKFFESILGVHRPQYAVKGAYSLWNRKNGVSNLTDGSRNQPFSSIISMLAEYGFIFFAMLSVFIYIEFKELNNKFKLSFSGNLHQAAYERDIVLFKYLKFISLFVLMSLFTDNYLEYPEIILFYLLIYKLIELKITDN